MYIVVAFLTIHHTGHALFIHKYLRNADIAVSLHRSPRRHFPGFSLDTTPNRVITAYPDRFLVTTETSKRR